jgi:hypothetical protein
MNNDNEDAVRKYINPMSGRDFLNILFIGFFVGSATWVLHKILGNYLFDPLFCNGNIIPTCYSAGLTTTIVTVVLAGVIALTALIRYRASRPLLAVIAVTACLWPIVQNLGSFNSLIGVLMVIGLYLITYGLFAWVMRIRNSWVVAVLTLILVVVSRLILTS